MIVTMHFGDGTFHEIEVNVPEDEPDDAIEEARTYVMDNAYFVVLDENGNEQAEGPLSPIHGRR